MPLSPDLIDDLGARVGAVTSIRSVSGGSICSAYKIATASGPIFLKVAEQTPADFFAIEAAGLAELRAAATNIFVPAVVGYHDDPSRRSWLALEWMESRPLTDATARSLGANLATLHRQRRDRWGWNRNGFIGTLPQSNAAAATWGEFWARRRLHPQLAQATSNGWLRPTSDWSRLLNALPARLQAADDEGPSLLHGDLWSGNVFATEGGPAIVDPASYYGHREVDLAMADLFGGFPRVFFDSYREVWPLVAGYELRRWIYQLYYLLVHVNLFGFAYVSRTEGVLRTVMLHLDSTDD